MLKLKSKKVEEKLGGISSICWIHVVFFSMIHSADFLEENKPVKFQVLESLSFISLRHFNRGKREEQIAVG